MRYRSIEEVRAALNAAALELCRARGDTSSALGGDALREAAATVAAFLRALPESITIVTGHGATARMSGFASLARMVDYVAAGAPRATRRLIRK
jgi:hypothetical protein